MNLESIQQWVLRWVAFYTKNLSEERRLERLDEIESDLWEHAADGRAHGRSEGALAFEIFNRLVRGIPADVLWSLRAADPVPQPPPVPLHEVFARLQMVAKVGSFGLARFFGYYLGALLLVMSLVDFDGFVNFRLVDRDLVLGCLLLGGALITRFTLAGTFLMALGAFGNALVRPDGLEIWLILLPMFVIPVILTLRMPPRYWKL